MAARQINERPPLNVLAVPEFPDGFFDLLARSLDDVAADAGARIAAHLAAHGMADGGENWLATGIQPRTLEFFEEIGILDEVVARGIWIKGQRVFVNGRQVEDQRLPTGGPDTLMGLPYGFLGLPQYETEAILTEHLATAEFPSSAASS